MSLKLDALTRCENYELDPKIGFKSQYVIAPIGTVSIPGMTEMALNKWALVHGEAVRPVPLMDEKDRLFGAFFGAGVDSNCDVVTAASFAGFNSKGRTFEEAFETYLSGIAGRFMVILDTGSKSRIYRDAMGHMPLFYNDKTLLAGSSIYLTIDRPVEANPICARPGLDILSTAHVFPMGRTADVDVRLMPGNHVFDLSEFSAKRGWPLRNAIRKVTVSKSIPVIEKMAMRLRKIVQGWIAADDVVLPLDASAGSRILLAAAGDMKADIRQICLMQPGNTDDMAVASVATEVARAAGVEPTVHTRFDAFETFGRARGIRHERKRLYWLRTSSAVRVPTDAAIGMPDLLPAQHVVLGSDGLDALQGGWRAGTPTPKPIRSSLSSEISGALATKADKTLRDAVADDYADWKASLPKSLHAQAEDFIRMELHQPAQAVSSLGHADHLHVSPFNDREFIELALKLPLSLRSGEKLSEALVAALDPDLAGLPYSATLATADAAE